MWYAKLVEKTRVKMLFKHTFLQLLGKKKTTKQTHPWSVSLNLSKGTKGLDSRFLTQVSFGHLVLPASPLYC